MDIENFMVNDWASLYKNDELIGIEKLTKQTFFNALNSNATINLEPISLTEELFMLNGWKKNGPYLNYKIDEFSTLTYYFYEYRLSCTWKGRDEWENNAIVTDKTLIIRGLKYVHELQQALRLHGLNKIADNFKIDNEHV